MDSELLTCLLKFIEYFPDHLSALSRTLLRFFLDNLCRNSCIRTKIYTYQHGLAACKLNDLFTSCYESSFFKMIDELQTFLNCPKVTATLK